MMPLTQLRNLVALFRRDERGSVLVLVAAALVALLGVAALAVDLTYAYGLRSQLQVTADAAALAAANELDDADDAQALAIEYAGKNMAAGRHGTVLTSGDVELGNWDASAETFTASGTPTNAVRVTTRRSQAGGNPVTLFFAQILGHSTTDVVASAVAGTSGEPLCLLALDPSASGALDINNGTLTATNCVVHVNSDHATAIDGNPNGEATADAIYAAGGYDTKPDYSPMPEVEEPLSDPLADVDPPAYGGCDYTNKKITGGSETLAPGVYCGGIDIGGNADVTLSAGIFVIKDGDLKTSGNATLSGTGVGIYVTGDTSTIDLVGNGAVTLTAPTTGEMAGMLMFQDRSAPEGLTHSVKGNGNGTYEGAIYLRNGDFEVIGNGAVTVSSSVTYIVARRFRFTGNASMTLSMDPESSSLPVTCAISGTCLKLLN